MAHPAGQDAIAKNLKASSSSDLPPQENEIKTKDFSSQQLK